METLRKPKHGHKKPHKKFAAGLSLDKFSKLKKSSYDKRAKQEKERALNAAKVNKLKKLKQRLGDKIEPKFKLSQVPTRPASLAGTGTACMLHPAAAAAAAAADSLPAATLCPSAGSILG